MIEDPSIKELMLEEIILFKKIYERIFKFSDKEPILKINKEEGVLSIDNIGIKINPNELEILNSYIITDP